MDEVKLLGVDIDKILTVMYLICVKRLIELMLFLAFRHFVNLKSKNM